MKIEPFKMRVTPEQSRQVQEIVFRDGGGWASGDKTELHTQCPVLVYDNKLGFGSKSQGLVFDKCPEPEITFAEFMARYSGAETTQFDIMRKIVTIAEEVHKNGDAELCSVLLNSLADYIVITALNKGTKPTKK